MGFEEFLQSLGHTPEQITAIVTGMKTNKIYLSKEENIDTRYEKLKGQHEDTKTQLATATTTIAELKTSNASNEALQTKVTEYEVQIETLKTASQQAIADKELDLILTGAKVRNLKAAKAMLDMEKAKQKEDGSWEGVSEQLEGWKTSEAWIFDGEKKSVYSPPGGGDPNPKGMAATFASQRNEVKQTQTQENPYANAWG